MDRRAALIYNQTSQSVEIYPPEGVPTACTFKCWDGWTGNDTTPLFSGTATIDTFSQALTGAAGFSQANRRRIPLTSAGATVGEYYLLTNDVGQSEVVRIGAVATAYVDTEYDLAYDYPATLSSLRGLKMTAVVPDAILTDLSRINESAPVWTDATVAQPYSDTLRAPPNPYRVEWTYTAGGKSCRHWSYFDIVRMRWQYDVKPQNILDLYPQLGSQEWRASGGKKFAPMIAEAARRVQRMIRQDTGDPNTIAEGEDRDNLVLMCTLMLIAEGGITPAGRVPDGSWVRERTAVFLNEYQRAVPKMKRATSDGSLVVGPHQPMAFRS